MQRRKFVLTATSLLCTPHIVASRALSNPLAPIIWFFFRRGVTAAARRSITGLGRRVIARNLRSPIVSQKTQKRANNAQKMMARSEHRFDRQINTLGGKLIREAATSFIGKSDQINDISVVTNEERRHGALCSAFVNDASSNTAFLENSELVALNEGLARVSEYTSDPKEQFATIVPIETLDPGSFSYRDGHSRPRLIRTLNGTLEFDSVVYDNENAECIVDYKRTRGRVPNFATRYLFGKA